MRSCSWASGNAALAAGEAHAARGPALGLAGDRRRPATTDSATRRRTTWPALLTVLLLAATGCSREPAEAPGTAAEGEPEPSAETVIGEATAPAASRAVTQPGLADLPPAPSPPTDRFRLPPSREVTLDNGTRLVLVEKREVPLVAFHATLAGGTIAEPADRNGVAALTAALLERGAGDRDSEGFAGTIAAVGGRFESEAGLEAIAIRGEFMARDSALMVELLADVLLRPALAADEFEKLKVRSIRAITAARDADLRGLIAPYARAWVYGNHPYGRALTGSEESLGQISHRDVVAFYEDHLGADRLTLTLVGDFDAEALEAELGVAFGEWRPAGAPRPEAPETVRAAGGRVLLVHKPGSSQTYFWIGNRGVSRTDPETPAIDLVNTLFGGRFTSMLNNALRVESGLTYGARSLLERPVQPGSVGMFSFCATGDTVAAIDLALAQLDRLHSDGFDQETLVSGRNYILGTWTLNLETGPQLAEAIADLKFYGLPDEVLNDYARRVAGVSREQSRAVVERVYPARDDLVFVLIGDGDAIRSDLAAYGDITELAISAPRFRP